MMITRLEKKDKLLIAVIALIIVAVYIVQGIGRNQNVNCVVVKINGVISGTYSLDEPQVIELNNGTNIMEISDGEAKMISADCPDKICMHQNAVSKAHQSIVCLPNRIIIEVCTKKNSKFDAVTN